MMYQFTDLSGSPHLAGFASEVVKAIRDDESMPGLYDDIYSMLLQVEPSRRVTLGNPAITAPASWWSCFFGLSLSGEDIAELQGIDL
ncbi:hypothetical protein D0W66_04970 [Escherichia coli]|uniref:hypothetical protein n=1 Tax=Citrobacter amalonaticus TaxID=35703 RepID=UPI00076B7D8F|nr:hypothetical protein [Citrobacter amalonaticus]EEW2195370.1 hypothetical protein [Escherichia coli]AMG91790.1 hypothetical protein AL479_04510 [Citrobacter amalonaticus]EEY5685561.1 hypothetical protein [Escherichia coli]EFB3794127.1 hypothetical protein [Escherichia coli]EFB4026496.1 hypothetical protein [Escherichia coli]